MAPVLKTRLGTRIKPRVASRFGDGKYSTLQINYLRRLENKGGSISQDSLNLGLNTLRDLEIAHLDRHQRNLHCFLGDNIATAGIALINETGVSAADQITWNNIAGENYFERGGGDFMWFDGTGSNDHRVTTGYTTTVGDFTCIATIYTARTSGTNAIIAKDSPATRGFIFSVRDGVLAIEISGTSVGSRTSLAPSIKTEHRVAVKYISATKTYKIWLDGESETGLTQNSISANGSANLWVGNRQFLDSPFYGYIKNAEFHNSALSDAVIESKLATPNFGSGEVASFIGDGNVDSNWLDQSGNSNDGTVATSDTLPIKGFPGGIQKNPNTNGYGALGFAPSDIGDTAGVGAWVLDRGTGGYICGARDTTNNSADLIDSSATSWIQRWGSSPERLEETTANAGFILGRRSGSGNRKLFRDGVEVDSNTNVSYTSVSSTRNFPFLAINDAGTLGSFYDGRVGNIVFTDGQIPDAKQPTLYSILQTVQQELDRI